MADRAVSVLGGKLRIFRRFFITPTCSHVLPNPDGRSTNSRTARANVRQPGVWPIHWRLNAAAVFATGVPAPPSTEESDARRGDISVRNMDKSSGPPTPIPI